MDELNISNSRSFVAADGAPNVPASPGRGVFPPLIPDNAAQSGLIFTPNVGLGITPIPDPGLMSTVVSSYIPNPGPSVVRKPEPNITVRQVMTLQKKFCLFADEFNSLRANFMPSGETSYSKYFENISGTGDIRITVLKDKIEDLHKYVYGLPGYQKKFGPQLESFENLNKELQSVIDITRVLRMKLEGRSGNSYAMARPELQVTGRGHALPKSDTGAQQHSSNKRVPVSKTFGTNLAKTVSDVVEYPAIIPGRPVGTFNDPGGYKLKGMAMETPAHVSQYFKDINEGLQADDEEFVSRDVILQRQVAKNKLLQAQKSKLEGEVKMLERDKVNLARQNSALMKSNLELREKIVELKASPKLPPLRRRNRRNLSWDSDDEELAVKKHKTLESKKKS